MPLDLNILVTVSKKEYEYLKERDLKLTSLERAGVDNWEGYDYSIDILEELTQIMGFGEGPNT